MKIDSLHPLVVNVSPKTNWTFVTITAEDGLTGVGECSLNGWEPLLVACVERKARAVIGADDGEVERLTRHLAHAPAGRVGHAVDSAIEQALTDIVARRQGVPVHALLGSAPRDRVPVYANINRGTVDRSPEGFAASARAAVAQGFRAIKIAPFDGVVAEDAATTPIDARIADGIARILAARAAIGPGIDLMVDCHWRLDQARAAEMIRAVEPARLHWLECPISEHPAQWPAIAALRVHANECGVRLAGAENVTDPAQLAAMVAQGLYDVVMPDVKYAGGFRGMLAMARIAAAGGVAFAPHNPTGPIANFASLHACALAPLLSMLEYQLGESSLFFDLVGGIGPGLQGGEFRVPKAPGLGVALDEAACARHPWRALPDSANLDARLG